jgi:hypothetical protein
MKPQLSVRKHSARDAARAEWIDERRREARAVIADVAHHSDHLLCIACTVLASHGESDAERRDARALLFVIDARRPISQAQRENNWEAEQ